MWIFSNSDQAQGYALAQNEINAADTADAAKRIVARLSANQRAGTNHELLELAHQLRDALIAENQRADFFRNEADKLCAALQDAGAAIKCLETELAQKGQELAAARREIGRQFDRLCEVDPDLRI